MIEKRYSQAANYLFNDENNEYSLDANLLSSLFFLVFENDQNFDGKKHKDLRNIFEICAIELCDLTNQSIVFHMRIILRLIVLFLA